MISIGFIGFGEAASSIAEGLRKEGIKKVLAFDALLKDPLSEKKMTERIRAVGVEPADIEEVVAKANVIIVAVPSYHAVSAAADVVKYLTTGTLYIDVTTASPAEKEQIADSVKSRGGKFVDGAMMGSLPKYKHKVPMLISGDGIDNFFDLMQPYNMNLTKINKIPGAATSIKFTRSIVAKGLACLIIESLNTAQKFGIEEMIVDSLCEIFGADFEKTIDRLVSSTITHASRRSHEMKNVVDLLRQTGVSSIMSEASKAKLEWIDSLDVKSRFNDDVSGTWRQIIQSWGI